MKSSQEFGDYLDTLIEKAPLLRRAGVLDFEGGPLGKVHLVPFAGELIQKAPEKRQEEINAEGTGDPLDDPGAYGLPPGSKLPWQEGYKG